MSAPNSVLEGTPEHGDEEILDLQEWDNELDTGAPALGYAPDFTDPVAAIERPNPPTEDVWKGYSIATTAGRRALEGSSDDIMPQHAGTTPPRLGSELRRAQQHRVRIGSAAVSVYTGGYMPVFKRP